MTPIITRPRKIVRLRLSSTPGALEGASPRDDRLIRELAIIVPPSFANLVLGAIEARYAIRFSPARPAGRIEVQTTGDARIGYVPLTKDDAETLEILMGSKPFRMIDWRGLIQCVIDNQFELTIRADCHHTLN